jgi:hypothetical protein
MQSHAAPPGWGDRADCCDRIGTNTRPGLLVGQPLTLLSIAPVSTLEHAGPYGGQQLTNYRAEYHGYRVWAKWASAASWSGLDSVHSQPATYCMRHTHASTLTLVPRPMSTLKAGSCRDGGLMTQWGVGSGLD